MDEWERQEGDWHITWRIRWQSSDIGTMCISCLRRREAVRSSRGCGERELEWSSSSADCSATAASVRYSWLSSSATH